MKAFPLVLGLFLCLPVSALPPDFPIGVKVKSLLADGSFVALVGTEEVPEKNLPSKLAELASARGPQRPLRIFVHSSLPLGRILRLRDVAKSTGFVSVRVFYFTDELGDLVELCFGKPFPAVGGTVTVKVAPPN